MLAELFTAQWWGGRSGNLCAQVRVSLPRLLQEEILLSFESARERAQGPSSSSRGGKEYNITLDQPVFGRFVAFFPFLNFLPSNYTTAPPSPAVGRVSERSEVFTAPTPPLFETWTCGAASRLPTPTEASVIISSRTWMMHQRIIINKVLNEEKLIWTVCNCNSILKLLKHVDNRKHWHRLSVHTFNV